MPRKKRSTDPPDEGVDRSAGNPGGRALPGLDRAKGSDPELAPAAPPERGGDFESRVLGAMEELSTAQGQLRAMVHERVAAVEDRLRYIGVNRMNDLMDEALAQLRQRQGDLGRAIDTLMAIDSRMEPVEKQAYDLRALRNDVEEMGRALRGELENSLGAIRRGYGHAVGELSARQTKALDESLDRVRTEMQDALRAVQTRIASLTGPRPDIESLRGTVQGLGRELQEQFERAVTSLRDETGGKVEEQAERQSALEQSIKDATAGMQQQMRGLTDQMQQAFRGLTDQMRNVLHGEASQIQSGVRGILEGVNAALARHEERLMEMGNQFRTLGGAVEAMMQRRGFQKLVQSERRVIEEQRALGEQLVAAGQRVSEGTEELLRELRSLPESISDFTQELRGDTIASIEHIRTQARESVLELREELNRSVRDLWDRVGALAGPRSDIDALRAEVQGLALALRGELKSVGASVAESRSVVEERLQDLVDRTGARLVDLGTTLGNSLSREVNRRFEAVARLLGVRLRLSEGQRRPQASASEPAPIPPAWASTPPPGEPPGAPPPGPAERPTPPRPTPEPPQPVDRPTPSGAPTPPPGVVKRPTPPAPASRPQPPPSPSGPPAGPTEPKPSQALGPPEPIDLTKLGDEDESLDEEELPSPPLPPDERPEPGGPPKP